VTTEIVELARAGNLVQRLVEEVQTWKYVGKRRVDLCNIFIIHHNYILLPQTEQAVYCKNASGTVAEIERKAEWANE
jgi:hypothetical protein